MNFQNPKILKLLKNISLTILLLTTIGTFNAARSQDVYNLDRCIQTALENNFSLKVARNKTDIASNNFTRGNAGMLPTVSSTNRFGGNLNNSNQISADGTSTQKNGVYNSTGSAAVNLGMTIFRGFQVQRSYEKLGQLSELEKS